MSHDSEPRSGLVSRSSTLVGRDVPDRSGLAPSRPSPRVLRCLALDARKFCARLELGLDWQELARIRTGSEPVPLEVVGEGGAWLLALRALALYFGPIRPEDVEETELDGVDRRRIHRALSIPTAPGGSDSDRLGQDRAPWRIRVVGDSTEDTEGKELPLVRLVADFDAEGRIRLRVSRRA